MDHFTFSVFETLPERVTISDVDPFEFRVTLQIEFDEGYITNMITDDELLDEIKRLTDVKLDKPKKKEIPKLKENDRLFIVLKEKGKLSVYKIKI